MRSIILQFNRFIAWRLVLGAGAWGYLYARSFAEDDKLRAVPSYLVAAGAVRLDGDVLAAATVFPKDRSADRSVEISTLDRPRILQYEARGWRGY